MFKHIKMNKVEQIRKIKFKKGNRLNKDFKY